MTALPRCSDGCGARLSALRVANAFRRQEAGQAFSWRSRACLAIYRRTLQRIAKRNKKLGIVPNGEPEAVAMGLVPAPRVPVRKRKWSPSVEHVASGAVVKTRDRSGKMRTCDRCQMRRRCRPMGVPDAQVMLCKECVP